MLSRRKFISVTGRLSLAGATMPLWSNLASMRAFAQAPSTSYKAVVLVTLTGGNDGNNMLVPTDPAEYQQYAALRSALALPRSSVLPLASTSGTSSYGLHPALPNIAKYYNAKRALFVANVGPLGAPATKAQLLQKPGLMPAGMLGHPQGRAQWESAQTVENPDSGWGGRIADFLASESGSLPPLLNAGPASIFTVGRSVQAVVLQANSGAIVALPAGINTAIQQIAADDATSPNQIVSQAAHLRMRASAEQQLILQAQTYNGTLNTAFPSTGFGNVMKTIAQTIHGRSVLGASRQIFYCNQGNYDTHGDQLVRHANDLVELDGGLGAFMAALEEMGLADQVLVCTHADFNRTMQANGSGGTDHAWGNHQIMLGGGILGGRILGTMPDLELGGSSDMFSQGIWIPTTSVTQMTAGIGVWMGLNSTQIASCFPDLAAFGNHTLQLNPSANPGRSFLQ